MKFFGFLRGEVEVWGGAAGKEQLERSDFSGEAFTWSPFIEQET